MTTLADLNRAGVLSDQRGEKSVHYKLVDERPKTFVLVFETNDELSQGLKKFASEQKLASASFKAIGALSSVKLGWLNWETKKYEPSILSRHGHELVAHRLSKPRRRLEKAIRLARPENSVDSMGGPRRSPLNFESFRRGLASIRDFLALDDLTLIQTGQTGPLDGRDVYEDIFPTTALRLNEPVSFFAN
jgi:hypothetical protein